MIDALTTYVPLVAAATPSGGHATGNAMLVTLAGAVGFGVFFTTIARRFGISAIVVLLLGGILVGPEGLGLINPEALGDALLTIIALSVGVILFEGGLSLDRKGYREASREIKGVLTWGVLVTWIASGITLHVLYPDFGWRFCLLAASLIIVTGPTVIGPLLKRIRVRTKLHHILHWEGVLIDPIGVFIALLSYELVTLPLDAHISEVFLHFAQRVVTGMLIGIGGGLSLGLLIKRRLVPAENLNITALAAAVVIFGISDHLIPESGLLSVTIAGLIIGYMDIPDVRAIKRYKAELIDLLIGLLFVLLAARLELSSFRAIGLPGLAAVLIVMLVIRPLNIFISTARADLSFREKLFLSWIAPRGIVAASMASLFALEIAERHASWADSAPFLEAFTYSVIAGTVLFQGLSAVLVGRALGVLEPRQTGWMIVGAHALARQVALFVRDAGFHAAVVDSNMHGTAVARRQGIAAVCESAVSVDLDERPELYGTHNLLAITDSPHLNVRVCRRFHLVERDMALYRWGEEDEDEDAARDMDLYAGDAVWEAMSAANLQALDESTIQQTLRKRTCRPEGIRHPERVLMCLHDGELTPGLPDDAKGDVTILEFQPFATGLDVEMDPDWVFHSDAESLPELMHIMLKALRNRFPKLDAEHVAGELIAQEGEYSSLVGYDVALPHFHLEEIDTSLVMVAKLADPLVDKHSGAPIRYVFLVLSPLSEPRKHLNSLAEISRFIMDADNRERLDAATEVSALRHIFFPAGPVMRHD